MRRLKWVSRFINYIKRVNDPVSLVTAVASVIIALMSVVFTTIKSDEALQRMDAELITSNRPVVLISNQSIDSENRLLLWNTGPGVAFNISVEVHLAPIHSDFGPPWCVDVITAAIELGTKSDQEMNSNMQNSVNTLTSRFNHPPVIASGIENGYKSSALSSYTLSGLYFDISYSDALGNEYYSIWDGKRWFMGSVMEQKHNDTTLFNTQQSLINAYFHYSTGDNFKVGRGEGYLPVVAEMTVVLWLVNESRFLKESGFGEYPELIKPYLLLE